MKVGDLVKCKENGLLGVIVTIETWYGGINGEKSYHCCLVGDDRIWLFEEDLEAIA